VLFSRHIYPFSYTPLISVLISSFTGHRWLWLPSFGRAVFFPLFLLCAHPMVFKHDAFPFVFNALFALSNGYLTTLGMMFAPSRVLPHEKEAAGTYFNRFNASFHFFA
jgi:hypothetical protein